MRRFVDEGNFTVEVPTTRHVAMEMSALDTIIPLLGQRRWMLVRATADTGGFVTSDHPVCLMWSYPGLRGQGPYSPGFGLRRTQVVFPISHALAVLGAFEIDEEERDGDAGLVAVINSTVIGYADRHVYARDDRFLYTGEQGEVRKGSRLAGERWFRMRSTSNNKPVHQA